MCVNRNKSRCCLMNGSLTHDNQFCMFVHYFTYYYLYLLIIMILQKKKKKCKIQSVECFYKT